MSDKKRPLDLDLTEDQVNDYLKALGPKKLKEHVKMIEKLISSFPMEYDFGHRYDCLKHLEGKFDLHKKHDDSFECNMTLTWKDDNEKLEIDYKMWERLVGAGTTLAQIQEFRVGSFEMKGCFPEDWHRLPSSVDGVMELTIILRKRNIKFKEVHLFVHWLLTQADKCTDHLERLFREDRFYDDCWDEEEEEEGQK